MAAPEADEQPQHLPGREGSQVGAGLDGDVGDPPRFLVVRVRMRLKPTLRVVGAFDVVDDFAIVVPAEDVRAGTGKVQRPAQSPGRNRRPQLGSAPRAPAAVATNTKSVLADVWTKRRHKTQGTAISRHSTCEQ